MRANDYLQMIRAKASTPEIVKHWLTECHEPTLEKLDLKGIPGRINVDEFDFPLSWTSKTILTWRGQKKHLTTPSVVLLELDIVQRIEKSCILFQLQERVKYFRREKPSQSTTNQPKTKKPEKKAMTIEGPMPMQDHYTITWSCHKP